MKVTVLEPDDRRWVELLQGCPHDIYSLPGYSRLEAVRVGGSAIAILGEHEKGLVLLPLVLRELPRWCPSPVSDKYCDATSPYGYPGAIVVADGTEEALVVAAFLDAALPLLLDLQVVSVFVRLSPILNLAEWFSGRGMLVSHGETVWLDLRLSTEELSRHVRDRFRSNINAASRDGLRVEHDAEWREISRFTALYHQTMRSVGAEAWYLFPESYFRELRDETRGAVHLFTVKSPDGIPAAGLFSECGGIVQYLFSGKDESGAHPHATKLLMVQVRDWAKQRGNKVMHLGGGLGARADSLSQFKRGFSKLTRPFHTWRWVVDPERHHEAVLAWEQHTGLVADDVQGYFPPYRKVVPEVDFNRL